MRELDRDVVRSVVERALLEDDAWNDLTTRALVPASQQGVASLLAKQDGVICGLQLAQEAFSRLDASLRFAAAVSDGVHVSSDDVIARISGPLAPILSAERVALNVLQHLSGVATATRAVVEAVAGLPVTILDTRKTTPGLRILERYAVRCGGGSNHRDNLGDAVLVKDNHLAAARARGMSIAAIVETASRAAGPGVVAQIEVASIDDACRALDAGAPILLLDNMSVEDMARVVAMAKGRALLEASGNVTLANVRAIAETGVDRISIGSLTHSARALDLSLEVDVLSD